MNTCLIHMQSYPLGAYCPYCGPPKVETATQPTTAPSHACRCTSGAFVNGVCLYCGGWNNGWTLVPQSSATVTFNRIKPLVNALGFWVVEEDAHSIPLLDVTPCGPS